MDVGDFLEGKYLLQLKLWDKKKKDDLALHQCVWSCSGRKQG
jgi:hypothetical protein